MFGSLVSLIFKIPFKQKIGKLDIDILDSRRIVERSIITSSPIESGSYINDHIIDEPTEISITGRISKFSLNNSKLSQLSSLVKGKIPNRLKDAHDELYRLKEEKEPFILITKFKAYEDMIISSLEFLSDPNDGDVLKFSVVFTKLNIIESQIVSIPNSRILSESAKNLSSFGRQIAKPITPSPAVSSKNISFGQFIKSLF